MSNIFIKSPFYKLTFFESNSSLISKGISRCFVADAAAIEIVEDIIRGMNIDEWEGYYPKDKNWVTTWSLNEPNSLIYNGKFSLDIPKLIELCKEKDIDVLVVSKESPYINEKDYYNI